MGLIRSLGACHYKWGKEVIFNELAPLEVEWVPLDTKEVTMSSTMGLSKVPLQVWSLLELVVLEVFLHPLLMQCTRSPYICGHYYN